MSLTAYKKKRKFAGKGKTNEPRGKIKISKSLSRKFVIHEHHASHLHWDLRLEMDGVLKSWALPKIPPTSDFAEVRSGSNKRGREQTKDVKRLAMHVEDHPMSYINFHGTIPKGNYGAGKVLIWDKGKYNLIEKNKQKIIFYLYGKKLHGRYCLIKTNYGKNSFLFFKLD